MQVCETHLHTLSLDRTASFEQIREAYQDLVLVWHPDRFMDHPRLYKKAEEKLKEVNQAYTYLKTRQNRLRPQVVKPADQSACPSGTGSPASRASGKQTPSAHPSSAPHARTSPLGRGISCPWLSLADAEFILGHYQFKRTPHSDPGCQTYHGGPFVLILTEDRQRMTLSVPCDSVQSFDRILLSIPCKSMGYFDREESEHLLALLQVQEA